MWYLDRSNRSGISINPSRQCTETHPAPIHIHLNKKQTPRGLVSSATTEGSGGGGGEKTSLTSPGGNTPPAPESLRYDKKHKGKEVTFQASKSAEWEVVSESI